MLLPDETQLAEHRNHPQQMAKLWPKAVSLLCFYLHDINVRALGRESILLVRSL